jgi:hypothetical protein
MFSHKKHRRHKRHELAGHTAVRSFCPQITQISQIEYDRDAFDL